MGKQINRSDYYQYHTVDGIFCAHDAHTPDSAPEGFRVSGQPFPDPQPPAAMRPALPTEQPPSPYWTDVGNGSGNRFHALVVSFDAPVKGVGQSLPTDSDDAMQMLALEVARQTQRVAEKDEELSRLRSELHAARGELARVEESLAAAREQLNEAQRDLQFVTTNPDD